MRQLRRTPRALRGILLSALLTTVVVLATPKIVAACPSVWCQVPPQCLEVCIIVPIPFGTWWDPGCPSSTCATGICWYYDCAPDRWVPFEAEVLRTHADGPVVRGRYYRSSDGSYRAESGPALDDIRVIFIANFVMGLYYDWNSARGDGWAMEEAPHLAEPLYAEPTRVRADLSSRKLHPQPLPLRKGESDETGATSGGFEAYEADLGDGATGFMVPALNFFTVILTRPDGSYEKFYNVDLVEPDPALFKADSTCT